MLKRKIAKKKEIKKATNFDELLDIKYGKSGIPVCDEYEIRANNFVINEIEAASFLDIF